MFIMLPPYNCFVTRRLFLSSLRAKELLYHKSILSTFVFNRFYDIKFCSFARRAKHLVSPPAPQPVVFIMYDRNEDKTKVRMSS